MGRLDKGHGMNGWAWLLFAALAVAIVCVYLAGRVAGFGRGEQDRGDLAEKNNRLLGIVRQLEVRVAGQHQRIVAMTAWEIMPWPDGRTSPVPVRPELESLPAMPEPRVPRPRRERRTSTAAFLNPQACGPGMVPGEIPVTGSELARDETPGPHQIVADSWWPAVEDEIWSARLWLATL